MNRRDLIKMAGAAAAVTSAGCASSNSTNSNSFKKSYVSWCYNSHWDLNTKIEKALFFDCQGIEFIPVKDWGKLKENGLECSMVGSHGYVKGMNNRKHWAECHQKLTDSINNASEAGFPNVISFTGFYDTVKQKGSVVDAEAGQKNCIEGFKKIAGLAERKNVTIQIEVLNSRVNEKMKGHPGYSGDSVEYIAEIIKAVGSPNIKILFDIYHVQVMQGDLIKRIRENKDIIGHVHTAGCPGRGELDNTQEINYPAVMNALSEIGYKEYVSHEFIPTRDPHQGLAEAFKICGMS